MEIKLNKESAAKMVETCDAILGEPPVASAAPCSALPDWHRLSIRYDGMEIMGVTVTCKRPENQWQMTALIRELLACMEAH